MLRISLLVLVVVGCGTEEGRLPGPPPEYMTSQGIGVFADEGATLYPASLVDPWVEAVLVASAARDPQLDEGSVRRAWARGELELRFSPFPTGCYANECYWEGSPARTVVGTIGDCTFDDGGVAHQIVHDLLHRRSWDEEPVKHPDLYFARGGILPELASSLDALCPGN